MTRPQSMLRSEPIIGDWHMFGGVKRAKVKANPSYALQNLILLVLIAQLLKYL